jgi:hypothetical protein
MRSWNTHTSDVRNDPLIAAELAEWLRSEGVKDTVAKMSPDEVLVELAKDRTTHPLEPLASAEAHRGVLVQPLLNVLDRCVSHPDTASEEEAQLFCCAVLVGQVEGDAGVPTRDSVALVVRRCLHRSVGRCVDTGWRPDSRCGLRRRLGAEQAARVGSRCRRVFTRGCRRGARVAGGLGRSSPRHHSRLLRVAGTRRAGASNELRVGRACRRERGYGGPQRLSRSSSGIRRAISTANQAAQWTSQCRITASIHFSIERLSAPWLRVIARVLRRPLRSAGGVLRR